MYAKLTDGKLNVLSGNMIKYTITEDDVLYYVQVINPNEKELNKAGYYKVILPDGAEEPAPDALYELTENTITIKAEEQYEEAPVQ